MRKVSMLSKPSPSTLRNLLARDDRCTVLEARQRGGEDLGEAPPPRNQIGPEDDLIVLAEFFVAAKLEDLVVEARVTFLECGANDDAAVHQYETRATSVEDRQRQVCSFGLTIEQATSHINWEGLHPDANDDDFEWDREDRWDPRHGNRTNAIAREFGLDPEEVNEHEWDDTGDGGFVHDP